ncbi:MAG: NAD-dependent epimerase/dehydratase family protein [Stellaceae bacterium]
MTTLVTGSAGFIGFHVTAHLLDRGEKVIGIDDLNPYYDVALKQARLVRLEQRPGFVFDPVDVTDLEGMIGLVERHGEIDSIIHLAAQAGVRYSLTHPLGYIDRNVKGQIVMLEAARKLKNLKSFVYASSSSVYGRNKKQPFSVEDRADHPVSLYAATKRAAELVTESYCGLYGLPCIGLRFFTVYGPWGRPDMAYYLFTEAILKGRPIKIFNEGRMARDFTYIDDMLPAIAAASGPAAAEPGQHLLYNLGNHRPEQLLDFIATLERLLGRPAQRELLPMQPGDVPATYADIESARRDLGFEPKTPIAEGLARFVEWYREFHGAGGPPPTP